MPDFWSVDVWTTTSVIGELAGKRIVAVHTERIIGDERDGQQRAAALRVEYGLDHVVTCVAGFYHGPPPPCPAYRPDHNGECLNCDEPASEHDL